MQSEARKFLEALFGEKLEELYVLLWTLPEKKSYWFRNIDHAIQLAESLREHDVYVGVGLSRQDYGASRRCISAEVAGIVGVWADFDLNSDAHQKAALPATIKEALELLPKAFPPTFIVLSGNGFHAWWLFREPWIFDSDKERQEAANLVSRWQTLLRGNAAGRGWAFDRLADLARLLRIPGTQNCKDPGKPKLVEIHSQTDHRYNPCELVEFLEDHGVPDAEEQDRAAQDWKETCADKPLTLDPSVVVPEEFLQRHMAADPRFKDTWLRQRVDLRDQSQSGYDLALANFGFAAGLSEQQTVELIIHHRRIHNQRPRTKVAYFVRTFSKALKRSENPMPTKSHEPPIEGRGQPPTQHRPDSVTARAFLCEQISTAIGVGILRIVKISGQDPTYRVDLESAKIAFPSVDKLVGQASFRMRIASAVDHLVPRFPGKLWDRIAQMMLSALTVEDGGDEASLVGAARMYVERYLAETQFIDAEEEPSYQTKFKPTIYEGQIAICSQDLQQHINKAFGENRAIKEVIAMLSAIGATSTRIKRIRMRDQSRWLLPENNFPPADYAYNGGGTDAQS